MPIFKHKERTMGNPPETGFELTLPQDILRLYWSRARIIKVLFGDIVVERYGHNHDTYSLYVVDKDVHEFQGGDVRVIQRIGGGL